jgi:hypothetical protein
MWPSLRPRTEASEEQEPFSDEQLDTLAITLAELRRQWESNTARQTNQMDRALRQEIEHAVAHNAALRRDLAELRGKIDALLQLIQKSATVVEPTVIELPATFVRHTSIDRDGKVTLIRRRHDDAA